MRLVALEGEVLELEVENGAHRRIDLRDKGVLLLADAYSRVSLERNDCLLMFVGPDEEGLSRLPALADRPGIRCIGPSTEPERYMAAADVFCLPSFEEPFRLVFLEAMAMKKPVVALSNGGTPEVVVHGRTGLLSAPGDRKALAANLLTLIGDPTLRAQMGNCGRRRVEQRFDTNRMVRDAESLYEELIHGDHVG
jgi:glycosyltransferase involved in cell wall biosynthesis